MRQVVGIRTDTINIPEKHEHIIAVKLEDETILTVGEVIELFESGEHLWMKDPDDGVESVLHVHECPNCGAYPYLCEGHPPNKAVEWRDPDA